MEAENHSSQTRIYLFFPLDYLLFFQKSKLFENISRSKKRIIVISANRKREAKGKNKKDEYFICSKKKKSLVGIWSDSGVSPG